MKHTQEGMLLTEIVLETFKLNGFLVQEGDQITKEFNLSSARWKILGALYMSEVPLTVPEVARAMGQTRQAVQRISNEMKKDGLLTMKDNPKHKRAKLIVLTDQGKKYYQLIETKQIPWVNSLAKDFDSSELDIASSVLQRLIKKLRK